MPDPTEFAITTAFSTALGVFVVTTIARKVTGKKADLSSASAPIPCAGDSLYQAPLESGPPPLPKLVGRVPTWFYNPYDLLGLGFVFVVFFGLVIGSIRTPGKEELMLIPSVLIQSIAFQIISAGIVIAFVIARVRPVEWLGLKWRGWYWIFLIAPGAVVSMWLFFWALQATAYSQWIKSLGVEAVQDTVKVLQKATDPTILGLMAFAAVIVAPICEEIVFRGYLYSAGKKFAGPWIACFCSALVFAAAHGSLAALLPLFIFGCVLVFIYEKTGSLWAPMAVHFCFNGATVLLGMISRYYHLPLDGAS